MPTSSFVQKRHKPVHPLFQIKPYPPIGGVDKLLQGAPSTPLRRACYMHDEHQNTRLQNKNILTSLQLKSISHFAGFSGMNEFYNMPSIVGLTRTAI